MPQLAKKNQIVATLLLALLLLADLLYLVHPWYERDRDASVYISTSRALLSGEGYSYLGTPFIIRPPGYPVLIAPVVAFLETDFFALNLFMSLFGSAGILLLFWYQRPRLGWWLAMLAAVAVWLNPCYQRLCNQVLSDIPGLTLLLTCLLLQRWSSRRPTWQREFLLGVAIGISTYVRSIVILLVPAIIAARLLARFSTNGNGLSRRAFALHRILIIAVSAGFVVLPWTIRNKLVEVPTPVDQLSSYSYSTAWFHEDPCDPDSPRVRLTEIVQRIPECAVKIAEVFGSRLQVNLKGRTQQTGPINRIYLVMTLLLVSGLIYALVKHRDPAEIFVLLLLMTLMLYFCAYDRHLLPLFVIAVPATVEMLRDFLTRIIKSKAAIVTVTAMLAALIVLDFKPRKNWDVIEKQHTRMIKRCAVIEAALEPDARLASATGFHNTVFLGRPVYSLIIAVQNADGDVNSVENVIDRYGINTVILTPSEPGISGLLDYFQENYPNAVKQIGLSFIIRVRP